MVRWPLAFLLLAPSLVRADDANWSTFGGAGTFTPNRHVRMEREDVRIALDDHFVWVHATFWFRNHGPARTVQMGFPDETAYQGGSTTRPIRSFRSSVDGKPVPVAYRRLRRGYRKDWGVDTYRGAWVKTVPFARNASRKVEVWYLADHGFAGEGWAFDTYVFKTGATWRGTIGRIETTVDWSKMRERSRPALKLTGPAPKARWTRLGWRRARLVVTNVKPRFDLDLTSIDGFWNFRLNGRPLPAAPAENFGSIVAGPPEDLRVAVDHLGDFFDERERPGATDADDTRWYAPEARRFGRRLTLLGRQTLVTGNGRKLRLDHPATNPRGGRWRGRVEEYKATVADAPYVRLRDVMRALGGTYTYVPREERVDLRLTRR